MGDEMSLFCYIEAMFIAWGALIAFLFYVKVLTKNAERHAAENVMLALTESGQGEMIDIMRSMVPQPTATNEIIKSLVFSMSILSKPIAFFYNLLNFQTAVVDARTPDVTILWDSQKQILEQHDFDSLDALDLWNDALKRDVTMLLFLLVALFIAISNVIQAFAG